MTPGPNHRDGCDGSNSYLSGEGYNRVRVCGCGAEDHAPDLGSEEGRTMTDTTPTTFVPTRFDFEQEEHDAAGCLGPKNMLIGTAAIVRVGVPDCGYVVLSANEVAFDSLDEFDAFARSCRAAIAAMLTR